MLDCNGVKNNVLILRAKELIPPEKAVLEAFACMALKDVDKCILQYENERIRKKI